jgi:hypothetical protein
MIVGTFRELKVGDKIVGLVDRTYQHHPKQPFIVLEIVTFDDWVAECIEDGCQLTELQLSTARLANFYRISVD